MGINQRLDRIAQATFDVGHRRLPLFRSIGIIGFQLALAVAALTMLRVGLPVTHVVSAGVVTAASFFGWGLLRRAVTGTESYVLLEHVWFALLCLAAVAWAMDVPVLALLDACSVALAVFLAFGRIACLTAGCCHGTPAPVGITYHHADHHQIVRTRYLGRRLFPVQLMESVGLVLIAAVGFLLAPALSGTAVTWFLISYALLRFGTEALRGDSRPHVGAVSVARIMSVVQIIAAFVGYELWVVDGSVDRAALISIGLGVVAVGSGIALSISRAANPLTSEDHLDEAWEKLRIAIDDSGDHAQVARTELGLIIVTTADEHQVHVSFSHPDHDVGPVAVALSEHGHNERNGVAHFAIRRSATLLEFPETADETTYFDRPSQAISR